MDNHQLRKDTEENQANMLESVLLKLEAHKNYIVRRIEDKGRKLQAKVTFDSVIKYIYSAKDVIPPNEINEYVFLISDDKTHKNVLDTYEDIYYNMYKRYYGRSEDSYLEKI